jgi:3,4-dihydroxy-2-butanone 4-phosphate synthase
VLIDDVAEPPYSEQLVVAAQSAEAASVAREGIGTGTSAADRAHSIRLLVFLSSSASDFQRPGHVATIRNGRLAGISARCWC